MTPAEQEAKDINAQRLRRLLATGNPVAIMARLVGQTYRVQLFIADERGHIQDITALVGQERTKRRLNEWWIPLKKSTTVTVASLHTIVTGYWLAPYANGKQISYTTL